MPIKDFVMRLLKPAHRTPTPRASKKQLEDFTQQEQEKERERIEREKEELKERAHNVARTIHYLEVRDGLNQLREQRRK